LKPRVKLEYNRCHFELENTTQIAYSAFKLEIMSLNYRFMRIFKPSLMYNLFIIYSLSNISKTSNKQNLHLNYSKIVH